MKNALRIVVALLSLVACTAFAQSTIPPLKMTTVTQNADGSTVTTTSEVGGSFAFQVFAGVLTPSTMIAGDTGVVRRNFLGFSDKQGNVFTLGPAGEVYRNAMRLYTTSSTGAVQKMLAKKIGSFGNEVYALGMTNNIWYRWDGTATINKWVQLPADFDVSILN